MSQSLRISDPHAPSRPRANWRLSGTPRGLGPSRPRSRPKKLCSAYRPPAIGSDKRVAAAPDSDHFGVDDDGVLMVQGASKTFNPSLADAPIAAQRAADPTAAGAEWDAEFRSDIGAFLDDELIDAAIDHVRP